MADNDPSLLKSRAVQLLFATGADRYGSDLEFRLVSLILGRPIRVYSRHGTFYCLSTVVVFQFLTRSLNRQTSHHDRQA